MAPRTHPRPHKFKQTEVSRAIRAASRAGQHVTAVTIDRDGQITVQMVEREADKAAEQTLTA
jgi:hypothetical protein